MRTSPRTTAAQAPETTNMNSRPLNELTDAATKTQTALGLRHTPEVFSDEANAFRLAASTKARKGLWKSPVPRKGTPYEHACTMAVYEAVAHAIDELNGQATALDDLVARTGLPHSQVNTAFVFLKERGCLMPVRGRRHAAANGGGGCVHLDAMTEYHALREAAPGA
jgi:hypothetical protein